MGRLIGRFSSSASHDEGIVWAARAADLGSGRSARLIAEGFYYGRGVERDHEKAYYWVLIAQRHPQGLQNVRTIETRLLQALPIDSVRTKRERARQFETGKGIAAEMVIGPVLKKAMQFTGTMERSGQTFAIVNGALVSDGQEFSIVVESGSFEVTCLNVSPTEVHLAIEGMQTPLVLRRMEED